MSIILNDSSFLNHGGLERILEELRSNIKHDELICSVRKTYFINKIHILIRRIIHPLSQHVQKFFDH
jgi:hypothetical protein